MYSYRAANCMQYIARDVSRSHFSGVRACPNVQLNWVAVSLQMARNQTRSCGARTCQGCALIPTVLQQAAKQRSYQILYSMPLPIRLIDEMAKISQILQRHSARLRLMIDNEAQIEALHAFSLSNEAKTRWSVYLKIDMGTKCV